jgi:hypothetical protein
VKSPVGTLIIVATTPPPERHRPARATRTAWIGCGLLGVLFVLFAVVHRGENVPLAVVALVLGVVTIIGSLRLRRCDTGTIRLAWIALRILLVVLAGDLVYSVVDSWDTAPWSLVATVLCAVVVAALRQLSC